MKNITINIGLLALLLTAQTAWGQIQNNQTELLKPFQAKLAKSKKFEAKPHMPKLDTNSNKNLKYTVPTHLMEVPYTTPNIRPLAMPRDKVAKSNSFYAKAGFGFPLSPLVELSYHSKDAKNLKYGVNAQHHSVLKGYLPNQTFSKTGLNANLTYFTKNNLAIGGYLGFDYHTNKYYGMDSLLQETIVADSLQQSFLNVEGAVHIFNGTVSKNDLNYRGDIGFYSYSDKYKSSEISFSPSVKVEKWFGKGNDKNPLRVDMGVNYLSFKQLDSNLANVTNNLLLFYLRPNFTFKTGGFKARLGVDLGTSEGQFFVFPDIELSYEMAKGALTIYGGAVGQMRQNSFRSLSRYNPYLVSNPVLHHTSYTELYGGAKGSIQKIDYDIKAGYALTKNLPYFINNYKGNSWQFTTVYDTANIIFVRGALDFRLIKDLLVGGSLSYNIYQTKSQDKAWHLPTFQSNYFVQYDLFFNRKKQADHNYLSLKAELYINAGVPYLANNKSIQVLQGLYDLNFHLNYKVSKNFGLFLDLNNVLHNQSQRWNGYRQLGFNGMLGIEVVF